MAETQSPLLNSRLSDDATPAAAAAAAAAPSPASTTAAAAPSRNHSLDNLRTFLTALVILHHSAIVYGGAGGWELRSTCFPAESPLLLLFNAVNQTFFMALFFFLSGRFTWLQMRRKRSSRMEFVRVRMLRILLPAVVFTLLGAPTLTAMVWAWGRGSSDGNEANVWQVYVHFWENLRGIRGPVWYLAAVMIFDLLAVIFLWDVREQTNGRQSATRARVKHVLAPLAWLTTILASFAIRIVYPVGRVWAPLNVLLAYVPQYIFAYCGGHLSAIYDDLFILLPLGYSPHKSLRKLSTSLLLLGLSLILFLATMVLLDTEPQEMRGGANGPAFFYAVWNEAGFILLGFAVVAVFLEYADDVWSIGTVRLARYSYAAFLLHPLVSVGVELAAEALMRCPAERDGHLDGTWSVLGPMVMTAVVGSVNVVGTWVAAWCFLAIIPFASRIL